MQTDLLLIVQQHYLPPLRRCQVQQQGDIAAHPTRKIALLVNANERKVHAQASTTFANFECVRWQHAGNERCKKINLLY